MANGIKSYELNKIIEQKVQYTNGMLTDPVDSMNEFYEGGLKLILTQFFAINVAVENKQEKQKDIETIKVNVQFDDVKLSKPRIEGSDQLMLPKDARRQDLSYLGDVKVDATITATAYKRNGETEVKVEKVTDHKIAAIPIMVRSNYCYTANMSRELLKKNGEDPNDPGAHFILGGKEWFIGFKLTRIFNRAAAYKQNYKTELARLEYISQPGDSFENSAEVKLLLLKGNKLVVLMTSDKYFRELYIPFYLVFRLLNMGDEKTIVDNIIMNSEKTTLSIHMMNVLRDAFNVDYDGCDGKPRKLTDTSKVFDYLVDMLTISYMKGKTIHNKEERQKAYDRERSIIRDNLYKNLDENLFPHQGKSPADRFMKARFLGMLINKLIKVEQGIILSTDRDSYTEKRVHDVGTSISKMIKKEVNNSVIKPIMNGFKDSLARTKFTSVGLAEVFKDSVKQSKLQTAIERSLNQGMGQKEENGKLVKGKMPSEQLIRKNMLNVITSLQKVRIDATNMSHQDPRAMRRRGVKTSQIGMLCAIESAATGASIGMVNTFSLGAGVAAASSNEHMKKILRGESSIKPVNRVSPGDIGKRSLVKVMVNGYWLGLTDDISYLYNKYKERRRGWDIEKLERIENDTIDRKMTMHWEADQIDFRVDRGRFIGPFIVVRNNTDSDPIGQKLLGSKFNYKKLDSFKQQSTITREHIDGINRGTITFDDLFNQGYIDFIAPEEMKRCLIAYSLEKLEEEKNNPTIRYTHVQIPTTLLGPAASICPFIQHNYPVRATMQTGQSKQTCGMYASNHYARYDVPGVCQFSNERPLIETIATRLFQPNGQNCIVAVTTEDGNNVEDSISINRSASQRGAFCAFNMEPKKAELRSGEEFVKPDDNVTEGIKEHANYSKLGDDGVVPIGTKIYKNDVLIGKRMKLKTASHNKKFYRDTSLIYYNSEPGEVVDIVKGVDSKRKQFIKIKIISKRPLGIGHKFSSRAGQKGMVGKAHCQSDMMVTESGIIPTLKLSPHAFPSRMTINQLIESMYAKLSCKTGVTFDGTIGIKADTKSIGEMLHELGFSKHGLETMYNGMTGNVVDAEIYISSTFYQRLQKFVEKEATGLGSDGPSTFDTRQPTAGKSRMGGSRLGEMETPCIIAHGAGAYYTKKKRAHCDGFYYHVCKACKNRAIVNEQRNIYICRHCGENADIVRIPSGFASHLYMTDLESMNVGIKFEPKPYEFYESNN
jgi:DNA-directed RNA polymerase II subunit RPB2